MEKQRVNSKSVTVPTKIVRIRKVALDPELE